MVELLKKIIKNSKDNYYTYNTWSFFNQIRDGASVGCLLDFDNKEVFQNIFYAAQFGLNQLKLLSNDEKVVEVFVGETRVNVIGKFNPAYINHSVWLRSFWMTVMLRDLEGIRFLSNFNNALLERGQVSFTPLTVAEIRVYMAMFKGEEDLTLAIDQYEEIERKFSKSHPTRQWIDTQGMPAILLIKSAGLNNGDNFNPLLVEALNRHKEFYSKKDNVNDSFGWISFPLLTACAYAYDKGISIDVESDYIPRWIFEGDFKDCELTIK